MSTFQPIPPAAAIAASTSAGGMMHEDSCRNPA
jgi:hypothetical protein